MTKLFPWLKPWLRDRLLTTEEDHREADLVRVVVGRSADEKLVFWQGVESLLQGEHGKAVRALFQREFARLQQEVLQAKPGPERDTLIARLQQQAWSCNFLEMEVKRRTAKYLKIVKANAN